MTTYRWDGERGGQTPLQVITTPATDFTGDRTTAELAVLDDGRAGDWLQSRRSRCNLSVNAFGPQRLRDGSPSTGPAGPRSPRL